MITLLTGPKGSGKTKKLIELVDEAFKVSDGHVICVEKKDVLRYSVKPNIRLVSADHYDVSGFDAFYGLLAGLCAGDHDITDILVDATLRIGTRDYEELADFLTKVNALSADADTKFVFTVSTETENIPQRVLEFCEIK
ncbi:MAG: type IV pilus twitching motility protein PilT [Clostridiales bacterium]|nr:type IV pilus twitching motility protein PilT [Clostridiales bacterium]